MTIEENVVYISCTNTNMVEHTLWKKIGSRWYIYFAGQEWVLSTMDAGTRSKLKRLHIIESF